MANKCNHCGKFLATTDGAKCSKCTGLYHRVCANLSPESRVPPKWICRSCKPTSNKGKLCTPVKNPNVDSVEESEDTFSDANIGEDNGTITLIEEIRLLRKDIACCTREMAFFREELTRINSTVTEFAARIDSVENRLEVLENEALKSTNEQSSNELIENLRSEINEREQAHLLNDIEIAGLREKPGENIINTVLMLSKKISVNLSEHDIVSAERSGPRRVLTTSQPTENMQDRPRPIVVRLARRALRDDLLQAARVRRRIDSAGIIETEPTRLYINERLTPKNRYLFYKAREEGKRKDWRFVWTRGGRIYIRRDSTSPILRIRSEADIPRFFGGIYVGPE